MKIIQEALTSNKDFFKKNEIIKKITKKVYENYYTLGYITVVFREHWAHSG